MVSEVWAEKKKEELTEERGLQISHFKTSLEAVPEFPT